MITDDDYKSPWENKDATVATGLRTITYSSDSDKKPAARKWPIKDNQKIKKPIKGPHLSPESVIQWMDPSTCTQFSQESVSLDKEDLGLLAEEAIPKALFKGGKS